MHDNVEDVYQVMHDDGHVGWYPTSLIHDDVLDEWQGYLAKKRRVEHSLNQQGKRKKESISEEPTYSLYRDTAPYNMGLSKDGYKTLAKYPGRAQLNDYHVPKEVGSVLAVTLNNRDPVAAGLDVPAEGSSIRRIIDESAEKAIQPIAEMDGMEPYEKAKLGMADDVGQRTVNLDDYSHDFPSDHAWERLYLRKSPADSQVKRQA